MSHRGVLVLLIVAVGGTRPHRGRPWSRRARARGRVVDECHLFLAPIVVEGGTRVFPDDVRVELDLLDERRFGNGMVHLRYRTRR